MNHKAALREQSIEDLKLAIEEDHHVSGAIAMAYRTHGVSWGKLAEETGWSVEQLKEADNRRCAPTLAASNTQTYQE